MSAVILSSKSYLGQNHNEKDRRQTNLYNDGTPLVIPEHSQFSDQKKTTMNLSGYGMFGHRLVFVALQAFSITIP